jgi:hypothetical protein
MNFNNVNQKGLTQQEVTANVASNNPIFYQGEVLGEPIMFNPTQADLDKLGITNVRLFENHYKRKDTNNNDKPYGLISLLFSYSPKNSVKDKEVAETLPEIAYGMYNIAVSNDDMIELKEGDDYKYYKVALIDETFNTLEITTEENSNGKKVDFFKGLAAAKVKDIHQRQVAKKRIEGYEFLPKEERAALASEIDLGTITEKEAKGLFKFNPDTCMVQKQGYLAYSKLLINMTNWGINYFKPLDVNMPFDAKAWTKLVNGDVNDLNKVYNTSTAFRYLDNNGAAIKDAKPKLWLLLYPKLNSKGYTNQEVLCPSNVGINNIFNATAIEGSKSSKLFGSWVADLNAPNEIHTHLDYRDTYKKVFGFDYKSNSFVNEKAMIKYPYSFDFMPKDKLVAPTAAPATDTTDLGDDSPF